MAITKTQGKFSKGIDDDASSTALTLDGSGNVGVGIGSSLGAKLHIDTSGAGLIVSNTSTKVRIDSDGVKFGTDTATANALDDYEEGTFTPTITSGVNSISYGARSGHYTKIGNMVYCDLYINYSGTGSGAQFIVSSLPYTQKNSNYIRGGGTSSYADLVGKTVQFYGAQGTTYFFCYVDGNTTHTYSGSVNNYLIGTFIYLAA
jgi:hypothetical protein